MMANGPLHLTRDAVDEWFLEAIAKKDIQPCTATRHKNSLEWCTDNVERLGDIDGFCC